MNEIGCEIPRVEEQNISYEYVEISLYQIHFKTGRLTTIRDGLR